MKLYENKKIDVKVYEEILDNGMQVILVPNENTNKKYVIWATKYGSIDNKFIEPGTNKEVEVPDGVAHYLEHKMFEQENGVDSLYKLMGLGLNANAYTTNDHTAYLFSGTENFYEGLDELMDFVQHPYFTDENVEKERGIIGQEIQMYDDEPDWRLYMNAMKCLYKNNPITIDTAGTIETISHITKETLYSCYNTFYHPSNMIMCIAGNFVPEEMLEEIKKRLLPREKMEKIQRIYPPYEDDINEKSKCDKMDVNMPIFMIGYRDFSKIEINGSSKEKTKRKIGIKMLLDILIGESSKLYDELYTEGLLMEALSGNLEMANEFSHVIIEGASKDPDKVYERVIATLENEKISQEDVERAKKNLYGTLVTEYEDVVNIGRRYISDAVEGIMSLDYFESLKEIDLKDLEKARAEVFKAEKSILSKVLPNK